MWKSSTTTEKRIWMKALKNGMRPIHPGEVLREEFLIPMKLTAHSLAIALHVPAPRINDIARERRAVSADTAMRLARFFNMSPEFWMGLQADYEMALAREQLAEELKTIRPFKAALAV
jgi:addiction module HigA family antidote